MSSNERQFLRLAPRQGDRRYVRCQRYALRARQQGGLQRVGAARQSGLELRGCLALLQEVRGSAESRIGT